MRAVLLKGHGGLEQLELRADVPVPVPARNEVLVGIRAAAINNTDINTRLGWYSKSVDAGTDETHAVTGTPPDSGWSGTALDFPRIQGADACGQIVAVGADVNPHRVGERVLIDPVIRPASGAPLYFGSDIPGAFAEFTVVPARNAVAIDCALTDAELASFPCAYLAAENMLTRAQVGRGDRLLVTGASGGVGSAAVQLGRRRGAHVTAVAGGSKGPLLLQLGASRVLARDAELLAELGRDSIDCVIDVVGGPGFPRLLDVLVRNGRYAVAGAIAGPLVSLDLRTLYLKDLRLLGCTIPDDGVFGSLVGYIERGEIRPLISAIFPLEEIAMAQESFMEKAHIGKIVLVV
ncbi:MAG: alcohol dehydrogenase family protein [Proteobacteria bacterium]|nr:alcohol dehydrogenase family protein [Pseudomonadota bacterium]